MTHTIKLKWIGAEPEDRPRQALRKLVHARRRLRMSLSQRSALGATLDTLGLQTQLSYPAELPEAPQRTLRRLWEAQQFVEDN